MKSNSQSNSMKAHSIDSRVSTSLTSDNVAHDTTSSSTPATSANEALTKLSNKNVIVVDKLAMQRQRESLSSRETTDLMHEKAYGNEDEEFTSTYNSRIKKEKINKSTKKLFSNATFNTRNQEDKLYNSQEMWLQEKVGIRSSTLCHSSLPQMSSTLTSYEVGGPLPSQLHSQGNAIGNVHSSSERLINSLPYNTPLELQANANDSEKVRDQAPNSLIKVTPVQSTEISVASTSLNAALDNSVSFASSSLNTSKKPVMLVMTPPTNCLDNPNDPLGSPLVASLSGRYRIMGSPASLSKLTVSKSYEPNLTFDNYTSAHSSNLAERASSRNTVTSSLDTVNSLLHQRIRSHASLMPSTNKLDKYNTHNHHDHHHHHHHYNSNNSNKNNRHIYENQEQYQLLQQQQQQQQQQHIQESNHRCLHLHKHSSRKNEERFGKQRCSRESSPVTIMENKLTHDTKISAAGHANDVCDTIGQNIKISLNNTSNSASNNDYNLNTSGSNNSKGNNKNINLCYNSTNNDACKVSQTDEFSLSSKQAMPQIQALNFSDCVIRNMKSDSGNRFVLNDTQSESQNVNTSSLLELSQRKNIFENKLDCNNENDESYEMNSFCSTDSNNGSASNAFMVNVYDQNTNSYGNDKNHWESFFRYYHISLRAIVLINVLVISAFVATISIWPLTNVFQHASNEIMYSFGYDMVNSVTRTMEGNLQPVSLVVHNVASHLLINQTNQSWEWNGTNMPQIMSTLCHILDIDDADSRIMYISVSSPYSGYGAYCTQQYPHFPLAGSYVTNNSSTQRYWVDNTTYTIDDSKPVPFVQAMTEKDFTVDFGGENNSWHKIALPWNKTYFDEIDRAKREGRNVKLPAFGDQGWCIVTAANVSVLTYTYPFIDANNNLGVITAALQPSKISVELLLSQQSNYRIGTYMLIEPSSEAVLWSSWNSSWQTYQDNWNTSALNFSTNGVYVNATGNKLMERTIDSFGGVQVVNEQSKNSVYWFGTFKFENKLALSFMNRLHIGPRSNISILIVESMDGSEVSNSGMTLKIILILIVIVLFVFIVGTDVAMHFLFIRPLRELSRGLHSAAQLRDGSHHFHSVISIVREIAIMQYHFIILNNQLMRMKAFLPQGLFGQIRDSYASSISSSDSWIANEMNNNSNQCCEFNGTGSYPRMESSVEMARLDERPVIEGQQLLSLSTSYKKWNVNNDVDDIRNSKVGNDDKNYCFGNTCQSDNNKRIIDDNESASNTAAWKTTEGNNYETGHVDKCVELNCFNESEEAKDEKKREEELVNYEMTPPHRGKSFLYRILNKNSKERKSSSECNESKTQLIISENESNNDNKTNNNNTTTTTSYNCSVTNVKNDKNNVNNNNTKSGKTTKINNSGNNNNNLILTSDTDVTISGQKNYSNGNNNNIHKTNNSNNTNESANDHVNCSTQWAGLRLKEHVLTDKVNKFHRQYCSVIAINLHIVPLYDTLSVIEKITSEFMEAVLPLVLKFNGVIEIQRPEMLLVSFGAHSRMTMHQVRAAHCALEIMEHINNHTSIGPRVGCMLDVGEFFVGTCGAAQRHARVTFGMMLPYGRELIKLMHSLQCQIILTRHMASSLDSTMLTMPIDCIVYTMGTLSHILYQLRGSKKNCPSQIKLNEEELIIRSVRRAFNEMIRGHYKNALDFLQQCGKRDVQITRLSSICEELVNKKETRPFVRSIGHIKLTEADLHYSTSCVPTVSPVNEALAATRRAKKAKAVKRSMPPICQRGVSIHSNDMPRQDETNKHEVNNQSKQSNISSDNESNGGGGNNNNGCKRRRVRRSAERGSGDSGSKRASCAQVEMNTRKANIQFNNGNEAISKANNNSFASSNLQSYSVSSPKNVLKRNSYPKFKSEGDHVNINTNNNANQSKTNNLYKNELYTGHEDKNLHSSTNNNDFTDENALFELFVEEVSSTTSSNTTNSINNSNNNMNLNNTTNTEATFNSINDSNNVCSAHDKNNIFNNYNANVINNAVSDANELQSDKDDANVDGRHHYYYNHDDHDDDEDNNNNENNISSITNTDDKSDSSAINYTNGRVMKRDKSDGSVQRLSVLDINERLLPTHRYDHDELYMSSGQRTTSVSNSEHELVGSSVDSRNRIMPSRRIAGELPMTFTDFDGNLWHRSSERIGTGAFSEVYRGLSETGNLVALKCFQLRHRHLNIDEITEEVRVLANLHHENIVQYVGVHVSSSHVIVIMEFVPGGSLDTLITNFNTLSMSAVRRYLKDILSGLNYLHMMNIVHCDVKPHNVLLAMDGLCKLTDFGSAMPNACNKVVYIDDIGEMRGTPAYLSPEVARGELPTMKSDTFSLGITMLELITGKLPWQYTSPHDTTACKNEELTSNVALNLDTCREVHNAVGNTECAKQAKSEHSNDTTVVTATDAIRATDKKVIFTQAEKMSSELVSPSISHGIINDDDDDDDDDNDNNDDHEKYNNKYSNENQPHTSTKENVKQAESLSKVDEGGAKENLINDSCLNSKRGSKQNSVRAEQYASNNEAIGYINSTSINPLEEDLNALSNSPTFKSCKKASPLTNKYTFEQFGQVKEEKHKNKRMSQKEQTTFSPNSRDMNAGKFTGESNVEMIKKGKNVPRPSTARPPRREIEYLLNKSSELIIAIGKGEVEPHIPETLDEDLKDLLRRCLHPDPVQRASIK